jgi:hypothetical protein
MVGDRCSKILQNLAKNVLLILSNLQTGDGNGGAGSAGGSKDPLKGGTVSYKTVLT